MALIPVVKYDGKADVFAWKYPDEELGTWTQLIVNETQEAVLYKGGKALDLFQSGRHTLTTANIPLLREIMKLPFGGESPFKAEVWYVNKIHSLDIKWGTSSPIQLQDPKYNLFISVRAFGQFGIQIIDSRSFLTKLVGTLSSFDDENVTNYFKGLYLSKVKDTISSYLIKKSISIVEINAYLSEISTCLQDVMVPILEEYGIKLENFYVNSISVPEDDPNVKQLKEALAKKAAMDIVGYSYIQERSFDTLEGAATNPSSTQSSLIGAGIGMGMGVGVGGAFGNQMGSIAQNISAKQTKKCPECESMIASEMRYCPNCGKDTSYTSHPSSSKIKCSECGVFFTKETKFCPECGNPYQSCMFCGADIPKNAACCPECGKDLPTPCPKCGHILNSETKFCPECGESLVKKCANCNKSISGNPKFCPECGTPT